MDLGHLLALAIGLLTGLVAGLKVIAPLTKTKVDDKMLETGEKVLDVVKPLQK